MEYLAEDRESLSDLSGDDSDLPGIKEKSDKESIDLSLESKFDHIADKSNTFESVRDRSDSIPAHKRTSRRS